MKPSRLILSSILISAALWVCMSWPLPKFALTGVPSSSQNTEKGHVRTMVPGDHLQFIYHLWLAQDTFTGKTPWFTNPYEFNTCNQEIVRNTSMRYYLPFSLLYSIFEPITGRALAWNLMGFISLWLTLLFTWLLTRRFTDDTLCSALSSCVAIIFPYRWITLMGGSPTGLSMMWVAPALYGLDVMVRDKKWWGAVLAGASLFISSWCDPHVTLFTGLAAPFWCIIVYLNSRNKLIPDKTYIKKLAVAAAPLIIFAILLLFQVKNVKSGLEDTVLVKSDSNRLREVAMFSPDPSGFLSTDTEGMTRHIYIGWMASVLLVASFLATFYATIRKKTHRTRIIAPASLLLLGIGGIAILSTGTNNPGGDLYWLRLGKLIPPYGMIRQAAKIFALLPVFFAVTFAICLPNLLTILRLERWRKMVYILIGLALLWDYGQFISPTICRLDTKQLAYEAVAKHAEKNGRTPHVLGIPLWPGDSHWTSINQYYVSLYRMPMVNGYRPTRRQTYVNEIYFPFESFNRGGYSDDQLNDLLKRNVNYLVLHENAFPEKVSPFGVSHTLRQLLAHPRIRLLAQDGPVWSFEILSSQSKEGVYADLPEWPFIFPSRLWQAERCHNEGGVTNKEDLTSAGSYIHLEDDAFMLTSTYRMYYMPSLRYMMRIRSDGAYSASMNVRRASTIASRRSEYIIKDDNWTWREFSVPEFDELQKLQLDIRPDKGSVDVDIIVLAAGEWNLDDPPAELTVPAPTFYHAGYTDLSTGDVVLSPDTEPTGSIFYGPKLPLPAGNYSIEVNYTTDAPDGTELGILTSRYPTTKADPSRIIAGQPAILLCDHQTNLRFAFDLVYNRRAELRIRSVTIRRIDDQ